MVLNLGSLIKTVIYFRKKFYLRSLTGFSTCAWVQIRLSAQMHIFLDVYLYAKNNYCPSVTSEDIADKRVKAGFIMLNTMVENVNKSFANIPIPCLRSCSQLWTWSLERDWNINKKFCEHDLRKEIEILTKLLFSFSIIVFNMMKLLVKLFIMKLIAQTNIFKSGIGSERHKNVFHSRLFSIPLNP